MDLMIKEVLLILINIIKKMFVFQGRSNNKEYLIFTIFEYLIFTPFFILEKKYGKTDLLTLLLLIFFIIYFFTYTSLTIRRLHDCNLNGWWYLLSFIFSPVVFIMLCFIKSNKEKNKYGEPPK